MAIFKRVFCTVLWASQGAPFNSSSKDGKCMAQTQSYQVLAVDLTWQSEWGEHWLEKQPRDPWSLRRSCRNPQYRWENPAANALHKSGLYWKSGKKGMLSFLHIGDTANMWYKVLWSKRPKLLVLASMQNTMRSGKLALLDPPCMPTVKSGSGNIMRGCFSSGRTQKLVRELKGRWIQGSPRRKHVGGCKWLETGKEIHLIARKSP